MADKLNQTNVFLGSRLQPSTFIPSEATDEQLHSVVNGYGYDARTRMMALDELRSRVPGGWTANNPGHDVLGPKEHGAWVESMIDDNLGWAPLMLGAIPLYTGFKKLGILQGRSKPSIEEMDEAYRGLGRGLGNRVNNLFDAFVDGDKITVPEQQILERRGLTPFNYVKSIEDSSRGRK